MFPRRLRPGQQYTATELSEMARTVAALDTASGVGGITLSREGGGFVVRDDSTPPIFGKITGAPTGAKYPWSQVYANEDGTFSTVATEYGIAGTAASVPAVELGGRTDVAVNSIVVLFPLASGAGYGFNAGTVQTADVWFCTKICPTIVSGSVVHIVQERQKVRIPTSWLIGDPVCVTDPTGCCPGPDGDAVSLTGCSPCGGDVALPLAYLNFSNKSGSALCLPDSTPLTRTTIDDAGSPADGFPGWVIQGASQTAGSPYFGQYDYCGGTYQDAVILWLSCGSTGVVVNYVGAYGVAGVLSSGPLNGTLTTADQVCSLFTSPGTLALGTLVTTTPASGSVDVTLSWS